MLKKLTAILLCITLLLTVSTVTGVLAAVTETNGTLTENFDNMSVTDAYFKFKGSQLENHAFLTNSYIDGTKNFSASHEAYKIVEKQGADGNLSKMLEMRSPVGTGTDSIVGLALPSYTKADLDAGKLMKYSYDFCIEKIPTSASVFTLSAPYLNMFYFNTSGTLASNSANFDPSAFVVGASTAGTSTTNASLAAGNWYRAEMSAGEDEFLYFSVYDKSGTKIYTNTTAKDKHYNDSRKVTDTKNHERLLGTVALGPVNEENAGFTVLIDNAEYKVCTPAQAGPAIKTGSTFTEATIKSGDTVAVNVGEATVAFDQKLADGFKATLTPSGGTSIECAMTLGKAYASSYFYTVAIPELDTSKTYTLSFENCKNSQGQSCESTITFKTVGAGPEIVESTLKDNGRISPVNPKVTVTFDQVLTEGSKVVVYKEGGEKLSCTLSSTSGNTYEITLPELEEGMAYTLDFTGCFNSENAASMEKISFTTKSLRIVKLTDDFEAEDLVGSDNSGYNTSKAATSPLVSDKRSTSDTIFLDEGYNGSKAIKISTVTDDNNNTKGRIYSLYTTQAHNPEINYENSNEYQKFVTTYRINIKQPAEYGTSQIIEDVEHITKGADINFLTSTDRSLNYDRAIARITSDNDGNLVVHTGRTLEEDSHNIICGDKWYNIVWIIDGESQTFAMIDEASGELIFKCEGTFTIPEGGHVIQIFNGGRTRNSASKTINNQNQVVLIDDFTLWKINPWEDEHKLTAEVSGEDTFNMSFNQPVIATSDMFEVYRSENNENVLVSGTPIFTYPDFCEMSVNYKGLRFMVDYTVDYSGIVSAGGAGISSSELAASTHSFTTGTDPLGLTLIRDLIYNSLGKDAVITANMQKDEAGTACIIIAFYDNEGNLIGMNLKKDVEFTANTTIPVEFTLQNDMSSADTIKVFAWDSFTRIEPIMNAYVE